MQMKIPVMSVAPMDDDFYEILTFSILHCIEKKNPVISRTIIEWIKVNCRDRMPEKQVQFLIYIISGKLEKNYMPIWSDFIDWLYTQLPN